MKGTYLICICRLSPAIPRHIHAAIMAQGAGGGGGHPATGFGGSPPLQSLHQTPTGSGGGGGLQLHLASQLLQPSSLQAAQQQVQVRPPVGIVFPSPANSA